MGTGIKKKKSAEIVRDMITSVLKGCKDCERNDSLAYEKGPASKGECARPDTKATLIKGLEPACYDVLMTSLVN